MRDIFRQHKDLVRVNAQEAPLLSQLSRLIATRHVFLKSWDPCGSCLRELLLFLTGLATLMTTLSCVEGEFSLIGYHRNSYCSGMTDFALKGVMYAKNFSDLRKSAAQLE